MAALVLLDASFIIDNSAESPVDLSDHVLSITLNYESDLQEDTAMGDTFRSRLGGLKDWSVDVNLKQDFAAAQVDITLFSLVGVSGTFTGKPTSASVSATNPTFSGECVLATYPIFSNSIGELAQTALRFEGNGTLTRAEA